MYPQVLRITNGLLVLSYIFFLQFSDKPAMEYILSICLLITIGASQLFWNNPVRYSIIHKIDGVIAKVSILLFIGYVLCYKKMDISMTYTFLLIITWMIYFFILSNYYSSREWCCDKHIIYHGMSHILCFAGSLYAFLPSIVEAPGFV
jgi:phosphatidylserine synthase